MNNSQQQNQMNNSQNGSLVSHSQSAHQIGHQQQQQQPLTPQAAHHQALRHQLQQHFANNNMGECVNCNLCPFSEWGKFNFEILLSSSL